MVLSCAKMSKQDVRAKLIKSLLTEASSRYDTGKLLDIKIESRGNKLVLAREIRRKSKIESDFFLKYFLSRLRGGKIDINNINFINKKKKKQ
jgi:hypothetical protein